MFLKHAPIQRKLMAIILVTSAVVLMLTTVSYLTYEYLAFRREITERVTTIGKIIASTSTAALAFGNKEDAEETLAGLAAERQIFAAALYDKDHRIFATWVEPSKAAEFPTTPENDGFRFAGGNLRVVLPVEQSGNREGSLFLVADMRAMAERFQLYGTLAFIVTMASLLVAYLLSQILQKRISRPILALAGTARAVSERSDYSVRATKTGEDELGLLTDAFNQMLAQIEEQDRVLRESEERFRLMVANVQDYSIIMLDPEGRIMTWNIGAERIQGYRAEEILGQHVSRLYPEELANTDESRRRMETARKDGRAEYEGWHRRPDGRKICVNIVLTALRDESGRLRGYCKVTQDITERRRAHDALLESEERFRRVVQALPGAIYTCDREGYITLFNDAAVELWGRTPELGKDRWCGSWRIYDSDGAPIAPADCPMATTIRTGQAIRGKEIIIERPDGVRRYVLPYPEPLLDINGQPNGAINMLIDITERRQSEVALLEARERAERTLAELAQQKFALDQHAIVAVTNRAGTITYVNDRFCEISKFSREELLGQNHRIINSGYHPKSFFKDLWRTISSGHVWHGEIRNRAKDGSFYWVDTTIVPFLDPYGEPEQYVAIRADITERKEAEQRILSLNRDLQAQTNALKTAYAELESFSYSVSHDLRTPLRSINGFTQALEEDYQQALDEEGRSYLTRVRKACAHMSDLIDAILELSQVSRAAINRSTVSLSSLVCGLLEDLARQEPEREVETIVEPNVVVEADPRLLQVVLKNLVGNAWKFTSKRPGAKIEFGARTRDGQTYYFVSDNGAGFDMTYASVLFKPFQRLHLNTEFPGTGVGLAIVSRIIQAHGGEVWADSEPGKGATFYFTLSNSGSRTEPATANVKAKQHS